MSKLWFTSDQHFGHARILDYCKGRAALWPDVASMNAGLVERRNEVVEPGDTVINLGDVAMGIRRDNLQYLKWSAGDDVLVPGNHDSCWEHGRDGSGASDKIGKHCKDYFEWGGFLQIWGNEVRMLLDNRIPVVLSHLPPVKCDDHTEELRFRELRPPYPPEGVWMLCGHVHEVWKQHGRVINVGVDVWGFRPVSVAQLVEVIEGGERCG